MTLADPKRFTDREDALRAYADLWTGRQRVLRIGGMSGEGKSTLLGYLAAHYETTRPCAVIDLRCIPLTRDDIVGRLLDQLQAETGDVAALTKVSVKNRATLGRISHALTVIGLGTEPDVLAPLAGLGEREWALFIDHWDELEADPALRRWFQGLLLPRLLARFHGLRIVLAAERAADSLAVFACADHRLQRWKQTDTDAYLAWFGLRDPALAHAVHEAFGGLPLLIDLAGEAWRAAHQAGQPFELSDVDSPRAREWLFDRLFAPLPPAVAQAARVACRLRRFNCETLCALESLPDLADHEYHALTTRTWEHHVKGEGGEVDERVRFVFAMWFRAHRPGEWAAFHARAQRFFQQQGRELDVLYHTLNADPVAGVGLWAHAFDEASSGGRAALTRLLHLPEVRAWLLELSKAAWYWRAEGMAGIRGVPASMETSPWVTTQQHVHSSTDTITPGELDVRRPGAL